MYNTGDYNTGDYNTGDYNTGYRNTGYWNAGNRNTGYWSTGHWNTGFRNTGSWNTGDRNTGDRNTGDYNTGDYNTGYGNTTDRETGVFNTTQGKLRTFNKETDLTWDEIVHPSFDEFYLTEWVPESDMTNDEKNNNPGFSIQQGYLKALDYNEAWANFWRDTDEENRKRFLALPNFDAEIFKEITGIDVEQAEKQTIDIGGKTYEVTEELTKALENLKEAKDE